ncbi:hypothetical protein MNBD_GAMMA08-808 [hydrothermal vent metagenome]|uniref:Uncharacterized protein n=1 Tax=hydrothermal vent metagenome TaxID=652676 RepID=A0A3B0X8B7_9ZZZZ
MVSKITLVVISGGWEGGHDGQYPILLEYNSENHEKPFSSSEGWGHGLSGSVFSIEGLFKSGIIEIYNRSESVWAYEVLVNAYQNTWGSHKAAARLLTVLPQNLPVIPECLVCVLGDDS